MKRLDEIFFWKNYIVRTFDICFSFLDWVLKMKCVYELSSKKHILLLLLFWYHVDSILIFKFVAHQIFIDIRITQHAHQIILLKIHQKCAAQPNYHHIYIKWTFRISSVTYSNYQRIVWCFEIPPKFAILSP